MEGVVPKNIKEANRKRHTGIDRTTKRVQADWFWPGMTTDIRRLVNTGKACQAAKHSKAGRDSEEAYRQGHTGVDRTTKRVQANWFWPGMTADIRRLVNTCEACQAAKHSTV